jgi:hypothetical protein
VFGLKLGFDYETFGDASEEYLLLLAEEIAFSLL